MKKEDVVKYRQQGWITRQEACEILGDKKDGSNIDELLRKVGIHYIILPWENSDDGRGKSLYNLDQVNAYKRQLVLELNAKTPVGGDNNGGYIRKKIRELEDRISKLESLN